MNINHAVWTVPFVKTHGGSTRKDAERELDDGADEAEEELAQLLAHPLLDALLKLLGCHLQLLPRLVVVDVVPE